MTNFDSISYKGVKIRLPKSIAQIVAEMGEFATHLYEKDSDGESIYRILCQRDGISVPHRLRQAGRLWKAIRLVGDEPDTYLPIFKAARARLEEQIKNGPSGPIGDDAPDNMDWLPGWQEERRVWWNVD